MDRTVFSFSATDVGYKHIKEKPPKVCEDFSDHYDEDDFHICVVADGHGSDNYPRTYKGSKFAVEACIKQIKQFVKDFDCSENLEQLLEDKEYRILKQLVKSILNEWYYSVNSDVENNPFTESELVNVSEKYKVRYFSENPKERKIEKAYGVDDCY